MDEQLSLGSLVTILIVTVVCVPLKKNKLEIDLEKIIEPDALIDAILSSETAWRDASCVATEYY